MELANLDETADSLRLVVARLFVERYGLRSDNDPMPWSQLTESEKNRWRDHARAAREVLL
jgi:hypothetical protein